MACPPRRLRRQEIGRRGVYGGVSPATQPLDQSPRRFLYLLLGLALVPLAWSLDNDPEEIKARLQRTIEAHPDAMPDAWYAETARKVYRPELYRDAAAALVAEGKAKKEDFPAETDGYRPATSEFIDGIEYDGHQPNAYLTKFKIGLKGDEKAGAAAAAN